MQSQGSTGAPLARRLQSLPAPATSTEFPARGALSRRCTSCTEIERAPPKSERYIRNGATVVFENAAFQRQAQDRIQLLFADVAVASNDNKTLIAKKVLKYRKLYGDMASDAS
jgi:hypothetical protein